MTSISILPDAIFLRNISLIFGAMIGVYLIYRNRYIFSIKNSSSLIALCFLFAWILAHYFFFAEDPKAQFQELSSVWKRVFLSFIFAIGLGLSIPMASKNNKALVVLGFAATTIIFYLRYCIDFFGFNSLPNYLAINYFIPDGRGYIPKYHFTVFIMPFIGLIYCFLFSNNFSKFRYKSIISSMAIFSLFGTFYIFYIIENKNGVLDFLIISFSFLVLIFIDSSKKLKLSFYVVIIGTAVAITPLIYLHVKSQPTLFTLLVDTKAALDFEHNNHWKYVGKQGYPLNEYGTTVGVSTYERVAWAVKGVEVIIQNPLGYGLVSNSFGYLAKRSWPDSTLNHTHSGWVDLGLAFGVPGLLLILFPLFMTIRSCIYKNSLYSKAGVWVLASITLVFMTSEAAERILLDYLIFLIAFFSAVSINAD